MAVGIIQMSIAALLTKVANFRILVPVLEKVVWMYLLPPRFEFFNKPIEKESQKENESHASPKMSQYFC